MEVMSKQLDLIGTMNSLGIDTSEIKEIAKETMTGLVKQTDIFLSANTDVKINNKEISRSEDIKNLLSQPRYLESATELYEEGIMEE